MTSPKCVVSIVCQKDRIQFSLMGSICMILNFFSFGNLFCETFLWFCINCQFLKYVWIYGILKLNWEQAHKLKQVKVKYRRISVYHQACLALYGIFRDTLSSLPCISEPKQWFTHWPALQTTSWWAPHHCGPAAVQSAMPRLLKYTYTHSTRSSGTLNLSYLRGQAWSHLVNCHWLYRHF